MVNGLWTTTKLYVRENKKLQKELFTQLNKIVEIQEKNKEEILKKINILDERLTDVEKNSQLLQAKKNKELEYKISKLSEETQAVKVEVNILKNIMEDKGKQLLENTDLINSVMEQMMKNILSLDEGNRLLIAKTLLKDLGD